jgi:ribosome-associated protein
MTDILTSCVNTTRVCLDARIVAILQGRYTAMMIRITRAIAIDEDDLTEEFLRAGGPGGQNVNKVATAVRLRFRVAGCAALGADVKTRLLALAGARATGEGDVVILAQRHRTQARNRADARMRLAELIRAALEKPRPRLKTRPSAASRKARLIDKRHHGELKRRRARHDVNPD